MSGVDLAGTPPVNSKLYPVGGMLYANAGYSRFRVLAGNVFLALSVAGK